MTSCGLYKKNLLTILVLCLSISPSFAKYSGGQGTTVDPFQIASKDDLLALAADTSDYDKNFILTCDIDFQGQSFNKAVIAWQINTSECFQGIPFCGSFNGDGHKIVNFSINSTDDIIYYIGLFGKVSNTGIIKNLGIENLKIDVPAAEYVAAIVGYNEGTITNCIVSCEINADYYLGSIAGYHTNGNIINCSFNGTITGYSEIGGIAGCSNSGSIISCHSSADIVGVNHVGGLLGVQQGKSNIDSCYSSGKIIGDVCAGGLVGSIDNVNITNSFSTADVDGSYFCGGLVAIARNAEIKNCYSNGQVKGKYTAGGLIGSIEDSVLYSSYSACNVTGDYGIGGLIGGSVRTTTFNCYASGAVTGADFVAGLIGQIDYSVISKCYCSGKVIGQDHTGGLIGGGNGNVFSSYWDVETTGQSCSAEGIGQTTSQMKSRTPYQIAGWSNQGWVINEGVDYPRLLWENTSGTSIPPCPQIPLVGSGTEQDPYQIHTPSDFCLLAAYSSVLDKHISLMNDIDLSNTALTPIGRLGPFIGIFNGNGFTLRNPIIIDSNSNSIGLFRYIDSGAEIRDLRIENARMKGMNYVAALAAYNMNGSIINCHVSGSIDANDFVGGLIAENFGTITGCSSKCSITARQTIGGLAGDNFSDFDGLIEQSCADCNVVGLGNVGGLVGVNNSLIKDSNASGRVSCTYDAAGGLAGSCYGEIYNSHSKSIVIGASYVGGLVGLADSSNISNCSASGSVTGSESVGGLIGLNGAVVTECRASGDVTGTNSVGGLIGENHNKINNSYAMDGIINGQDYVGGLIGHNVSANITSSYTKNYVEANSYVGGLVGYHFNNSVYDDYGKIVNSYSQSSVNGNDYIGGLAGYSRKAEIYQSYFAGGLTCWNDYVGGLVGDNFGSYIHSCFNKGFVSGNKYSGGLVGWNDDNSRIENCYAACEIWGETIIGGLVGLNSSTVCNCYFVGNPCYDPYFQPIAGKNYNSITNCFWDMDATGITQGSDENQIGKTTAEMLTASTFIDKGWDFVGEYNNGTEDIWRMCVDGISYPKLNWNYEKGDFACPDGVDYYDLAFFADYWLYDYEEDGKILRWDFEHDNVIDMADLKWFIDSYWPDDANFVAFADFARYWQKRVVHIGNIRIDLNKDGIVNFVDFSIFAEHWLDGLNNPDYIQSFTTEDCGYYSGCNIIQKYNYIYLGHFIFATSCDRLGLNVSVDGNYIRINETVTADCSSTSTGCFYPITATLGPFPSGSYVVELLYRGESVTFKDVTFP
jgi:hypothetical protein